MAILFFKITRRVWSDCINVCDEVFDQYMELFQYMQCYQAFFVIQRVQVYTRSYRDISISASIWKETTVFDWYTLFLRHSGKCIETFFICCTPWQNVAKKEIKEICWWSLWLLFVLFEFAWKREVSAIINPAKIGMILRLP